MEHMKNSARQYSWKSGMVALCMAAATLGMSGTTNAQSLSETELASQGAVAKLMIKGMVKGITDGADYFQKGARISEHQLMQKIAAMGSAEQDGYLLGYQCVHRGTAEELQARGIRLGGMTAAKRQANVGAAAELAKGACLEVALKHAKRLGPITPFGR